MIAHAPAPSPAHSTPTSTPPSGSCPEPRDDNSGPALAAARDIAAALKRDGEPKGTAKLAAALSGPRMTTIEMVNDATRQLTFICSLMEGGDNCMGWMRDQFAKIVNDGRVGDLVAWIDKHYPAVFHRKYTTGSFQASIQFAAERYVYLLNGNCPHCGGAEEKDRDTGDINCADCGDAIKEASRDPIDEDCIGPNPRN